MSSSILIEGYDVESDADDEYPKLNLPDDRLSPSRIITWYKCGELFRRQYVDRVSFKRDKNLLTGSLVHKIVEVSLNMKLNGISLPKEDINDLCSTTSTAYLTPDVVEEVAMTRAEIDDLKDDIKNLYKLWYKEVYPHVNPIGIEKEIRVTIAGVPFLGYIDYINRLSDGSSVIMDLKVTARKKPESDARNSLQLAVYSIAENIPVVGFDNIIKGEDPRLNQIIYKFEPGELSWYTQLIRRAAEAISAGVFPMASPDSWACSEKFCPQWKNCRGKK